MPRDRRPGTPPLPSRIDSPVTIERLVAGGFGLARVLGRVVLVSGAAPGDIVTLAIDRAQGGVAFAHPTAILEPSPDRVEPPHPELTRCGGADLQHLAYDAQLRVTGEIVAKALRRVGGIDRAEPVPVVPSPSQWGYRGRAEWRHDPRDPALGYVAAGTHDACDLEADPFVVPALQSAFADLRQRMARGDLPADAREFRAAAGDDGVSLAPDPDGGDVREVVLTVAGERLRHDATAFFQANHGLLGALVEEALRFAASPDDLAAQPPDTMAIDLYAGVGLFTLPLLRRYRRVVAVESEPATAAHLARNAADAGLRGLRVVEQRVEAWLPLAYRSFGRPAFLLLDPPRTGLPAVATAALLRLRPERISYVSCDPATLARDLKRLLERDYRLERVVALDLFPQTHHVEAVAHLVRAEPEEP